MANVEEIVGIAGTGRIGQALGRLLRERGGTRVAIGGRDPERSAVAAAFIGAGAECLSLEGLPGKAHRILIAVSDEAIGSVAERLAAGMKAGVVLHTCGAHGPGLLEPLARAGVHCGVLHPLQTVATAAQGVASLPGSGFLVDGDEEARRWGAEIVSVLGGRLLEVPADRRPLYHAAAVLASNCVTALLSAAAVTLGGAGVPEGEALAALGPLARSSVENALSLGPVEALTGPVRRGDVSTVAAHLKALECLPPGLGEVYRALGMQALALAEQAGLPPDKARRIEAMLR